MLCTSSFSLVVDSKIVLLNLDAFIVLCIVYFVVSNKIPFAEF